MEILFFYTPETKAAERMRDMLRGYCYKSIDRTSKDPETIAIMKKHGQRNPNVVLVLFPDGSEKRMINPDELNEFLHHVR